MKGDLDQAQKELVEAKPMVTQIENLKEKLGQASKKAAGLEDKVKQLKYKVEEVKEAGVAKFKDLVGY